MTPPRPDSTTELLAELGWVRRLARRLVGEDAEDLTQEVAALALEREPRRGLRAWLGAVTRKRAARWRRNRVRRNEIESTSEPQPRGDDPAAVVARLEQQRELAQAVLELTEPYRSVIVARFFDELPPSEIARRREVPAATVRQQIHRGLERLRHRLEQERGPEWRRALMGLVPAGTGPATLGLGGLIAMKKLILVAAAAVVLLAVWSVLPRGDGKVLRETIHGQTVTAVIPERGEEPGAAATERTPIPDLLPLQLEVVTDTGEPVADAMIFVQGGGALRSAHTDTAGKVSFEPEPSAGSILVLPQGRPALLQHLETLAGPRRIELPPGESVAGYVYIFDRPLPGPVDLELSGDRFTPFEFSELTREMRAVLAEQRLDVGRLRLRTDSTGSFSFHGLPRDWSGTLSLRNASPYWIRPQESSLEIPNGLWLGFKSAAVPHPMEDIVLSLTRLPSVRGRVVWRDGAPAARASIAASVSFEGQEGGVMIASSSDPDGSFEIGLWHGSESTIEGWLDPANHERVDELTLSWSHDLAKAKESLEVPPSKITRNLDVGVLVLDRAPTLHILVADSEGTPIAGAVAGPQRMVSPTDQDGRGIVQVEETGQRTFRIGAPGYRVEYDAAESGTGTATDPLRFTLKEGNRLTIEVRPSELELGELQLGVQSAEPPFTAAGNERWRPSPMHEAAGSTWSPTARWRVGDSGEAYYDLGEDGRVVLASLIPDQLVHLRVLDPIRHVVIEREVRLPEFGREELVVLESEDRVSTIRGTVLCDGVPVPGAHVSGLGGSSTSDEDGIFTARLLATGKPIEVEVEHPEHPTLTTEIDLLAGLQTPRLVLQRGYTLDVHVLDPSGSPVEADVRFTDWQTGGLPVILGPGSVQIRRLPGRTQTLQAHVAGRVFEQSVNPATRQSVELRVPALSRVRLRLPAGLSEERLVLKLEDSEAGVQLTQELQRVEDRWIPDELRVFPGTYRVTCGPEKSEGEPPWSTVWMIEAGDVEKAVLR